MPFDAAMPPLRHAALRCRRFHALIMLISITDAYMMLAAIILRLFLASRHISLLAAADPLPRCQRHATTRH